MAIPYQNNGEILTFFNKAQSKIAELGNLMAKEQEDDYHLQMLLGLSNFLESLDSPYNGWSETDIIRYIHYWNKRADLNNIPYIQITNYVVNINNGGNSGSVGNIEALVRQILSTYSHNQFAGIQGGNSTEKYHLTKAEHDWIQCQLIKSPCPDIIQPTISLTKTSNGVQWSSGFYELGTVVNVTTLQGLFNLNSATLINYYTYKRGNLELDTVLNPNPIMGFVPYIDRTSITRDTTYSVEAEFVVGGIKSDSKSILFKQPMYYGRLKKNLATATTALTLVKDVRAKGYMELVFTMPPNNTLITDDSFFTPVVFFSYDWGIPLSVKVLDFEFITDWTFTKETMVLANGTTADGYLGKYNKNFEGTTTFKFSF